MSNETIRTKTGAGVLEDVIREGPVDRHQMRTRRRLLWIVLLVVLVIVAWQLLAGGPADAASAGAFGDAPANAAIPLSGGLLAA